jgi:predicted MFS family arabinose efflux permease
LAASSWVADLGDGFALAAGPLLIASQSRNPTLVALGVLLQRLPWLLFGLLSGVTADRRNRVRLAALVELARVAVLAVLAATIITGAVNIPVVLAALFALGTAEVFSDTASTSLLPSLVSRSDLPAANARIMGGLVSLNQLAGPPIGAALFAAGMAVPFIAQAVLVGFGAVLISRISIDVRPTTGDAHLWAQVTEGARWTFHHAAVRTLVITIFIFNITFGAAWSVLVLYAQDRLHLGAIGFGILTGASAAGGLAGIGAYGRLTRRVSLGNIMRVGLIIETLTHLGLALTTVPAVAIAIMVVFGAHAFMWGTTAVTVRQRAVPEALQGRVASVNSIGVYAGLVIGAALGGPIASHYGITGPFWFGFIGSALFVAVMWRQFTHIAHSTEDIDAPHPEQER